MAFAEVAWDLKVRWREFDVGGREPPTPGRGEAVVPDRGSCYYFQDNPHPLTVGRFIIWRTRGNILELMDASTNTNLVNNALRFAFPGSILPDVAFLESQTTLVAFVATTRRTLHRITFPHPTSLTAQRVQSQQTGDSIFNQTPSVQSVSLTSNVSLSCMTIPRASTWVFGTTGGGVLTASETEAGGLLERELQQGSFMQRMVSVVRVFQRAEPTYAVTALSSMSTADDDYVFVMTADGRLRIWSLNTRRIVLERDFLELPADAARPVGKHLMRIFGHGENDVFYAAVSIGRVDHSDIIRLSGSLRTNELHTEGQVTLAGPSEIVDFQIEHTQQTIDNASEWVLTKIWVLLRDGERMRTAYTPVAREGHVTSFARWVVCMTPQIASPVPPLGAASVVHRETADVYLDAIFAPGAFSSNAITRALRSIQGEVRDARGRGPRRQDVASAVENQIQEAVRFEPLPPDEHRAVVDACWGKFLAACTSARDSEAAPIGLSVHAHTGLVMAVARHTQAACVPAEALDAAWWSLTQPSAQGLGVGIVQAGDLHPNETVSLLEAISSVASQLGERALATFDHDISSGIDPLQAATSHTMRLISGNELQPHERLAARQFGLDFMRRLRAMRSLVQAVEHLLDTIAGEGMPQVTLTSQPHVLPDMLHTALVESIVCAYAAHAVAARRTILRDLLLALYYVEQLRHLTGLAPDQLGELSSTLIPRTRSLLTGFTLAQWAAGRELDTPAVSSDQYAGAALPVAETISAASPPQSVLQALYRTGFTALVTACGAMGGAGPLGADVQRLAHALLRGLDVVDMDGVANKKAVAVVAALSTRHQIVALTEAIRALGTTTPPLLHFLGEALLATGQALKARDCFMAAAAGVTASNGWQEEPFAQALMDDNALTAQVPLPVRYYTRIMQLCEAFGQLDVAMSFAQAGLAHMSPRDEHIAVLWANVFKYAVACSNYDMAYEAVIANHGFTARKITCLRKFIDVLCERGAIQQLCAFPFVGLQDEVERSLLQRAQASDLALEGADNYAILFAYHTFHGNHRAAGACMYELASRLTVEMYPPGVPGLQRQANAYLAALNSLRLVDAANAWILVPGAGGADSKRRRSDDEAEPMTLDESGRLPPPTIVQIANIEKEYLKVKARLALANFASAGGRAAVGVMPLTPEEASTLLADAGQFDLALSVARQAGADLRPIFESMATKTVQIQNGDHVRIDDEWWTAAAGAMPVGQEGAAAWRAICALLRRYDNAETGYAYAVAVAEKVTALDPRLKLPNELVTLLTQYHPAALMRVYLRYGAIEAAAGLALSQIREAQNQQNQGARSWLPLTVFDQLRAALKEEVSHATDERKARLLALMRRLEGDFFDKFLEETSRNSHKAVAEGRSVPRGETTTAMEF